MYILRILWIRTGTKIYAILQMLNSYFLIVSHKTKIWLPTTHLSLECCLFALGTLVVKTVAVTNSWFRRRVKQLLRNIQAIVLVLFHANLGLLLTLLIFPLRYGIISPQVSNSWSGDPAEGCRIIMNDAGIDSSKWQAGKTKLFLKEPSTVSFLDYSKN